MKIENLTSSQSKVLEVFSLLSTRERIILDLRFGERKTQEEVAEVLKITNERVRQLETKALKTLLSRIK